MQIKFPIYKYTKSSRFFEMMDIDTILAKELITKHEAAFVVCYYLDISHTTYYKNYAHIITKIYEEGSARNVRRIQKDDVLIALAKLTEE